MASIMKMFGNVLEISLICSLIIILISIVSPILIKRRTVFWRYALWIVLSVRLVIPFDLSVEEAFIVLPSPIVAIEGSKIQEEVEKSNVLQTETAEMLRGNTFDELYNEKDLDSEVEERTAENEAVTFEDNKSLINEVPVNETFANAEGVSAKSEGNVLENTILNCFSRINWYYIFSLVWLAGVVVSTVFQITSYLLFKNSLKVSKVLLFHRKHVPVYISDLVTSPMLLGIIKPQIFLPQREYTKEGMEYILSHEMTHYKRKDLWVKLLIGTARTIHWFNPLVYLMERVAGKDIELLCDSEVVKNYTKEEKKQYSEILLAFAGGYKYHSYKLVCSSEFAKDVKMLKERFANIFAEGKHRKGIVLTIVGVTLIVLASLFVQFGEEEKSNSSGQNETISKEQEAPNATTVEEVSMLNFLIIGHDSFVEESEFFGAEKAHADTIMVVTVNQETERVVFTSFLRDTYVNIPGHEKGKLADSYLLGGSELLAKTLNENFSINIHGILDCDYKDFENVVDTFGGVMLNLSAAEAGALNTTNYVSEPENRTLKKGHQKLNGNQALGYVRIRSVQDYEGNSGDIARGSRQRKFMESLYIRCREMDKGTLEKLLWGFADGMEIELPYEWCDKRKLLDMALWAMSAEEVAIEQFCVPMEGSYEAKTIGGKTVLIMDNEKVKEALSKETHGEGWYKEEYLFQDEEGWQYYLEEDENQESCIYDVKKLEFVPDRIMLLVRYKGSERQVIEDLIWEDFTKNCPILYMEDAERIIYKAAPTASIIGLKDPVMVSLSLDGTDRKIADTILYHHFENVCEDNGWIYYMGWTNDRSYPRTLCRIRPDFETEPQYVCDLPGSLCGVQDNWVFYLASEEKEKPGIYKRNLLSGEEVIHDKWGVYAEEIAYFYARERLYAPGELLYDREIEGSNILWSYEYGEEIHNYHVPLYTEY